MKAKILIALALLALSTSAAAQESADEQARTLFTAGVQAYKQGQFMTAAQAFIKAHRVLPKPELLFSTAQAFRREFDDNEQRPALVMAVRYYRQYLDEVSEGGRRLEATKALGDLKPYLDKLGGDASTEMTFPTRLSVNSPTPSAVVTLDGGAPHPVPWNTTIAPGSHKIVVRASGYQPQERSFSALEGDILPFDVPLEGRPPTLQVAGADGADVTVDGKLLGSVPFSQPLELSPGRHFVTVTARGHKAYAEEIDFRFGSQTTVDVELPATDQRRWAWGVLAAGGAGLVAGGVLVALALVEEGSAQDIADKQAAGTISEEERQSYNDSIGTRDDLVKVSAIAAGAGAAVAITGLFLLFFDEPAITPPLGRAGDDGEPAPKAAPTEIEVMGAPIVAPGVYGVGLTGRF
jgi:hypothetical protein